MCMCVEESEWESHYVCMCTRHEIEKVCVRERVNKTERVCERDWRKYVCLKWGERMKKGRYGGENGDGERTMAHVPILCSDDSLHCHMTLAPFRPQNWWLTMFSETSRALSLQFFFFCVCGWRNIQSIGNKKTTEACPSEAEERN